MSYVTYRIINFQALVIRSDKMVRQAIDNIYEYEYTNGVMSSIYIKKKEDKIYTEKTNFDPRGHIKIWNSFLHFITICSGARDMRYGLWLCLWQ